MGMVQSKVSLVSGGASDVGQASSVPLASEGAHAAIADFDDRGGEEAMKLISSAGGSAEVHHLDASDYDQMRNLVAEVAMQHGSLDGAFNNAGVSGPIDRISKLTTQDWDQVTTVNLTGIFAGVKCEVAQMLLQGTGGSIVNRGSTCGLAGVDGKTAYNASKFGVVGITRTVAHEYATKNIWVNAVCPGFTETPMLTTRTDSDPSLTDYFDNHVPMGRKRQSSEIAEAAMWLLSDRSSYVTGVALPVDGGYIAR